MDGEEEPADLEDEDETVDMRVVMLRLVFGYSCARKVARYVFLTYKSSLLVPPQYSVAFPEHSAEQSARGAWIELGLMVFPQRPVSY